jgi:hypothetical protein
MSTCDRDLGPPADPATEEVAADDPTFVEECRSAVDHFVARLAMQLGQHLLTRSDKWGLVWRVDFIYFDHDLSPYINRIVCWRTDNGKVAVSFTVGQLLMPLPAVN